METTLSHTSNDKPVEYMFVACLLHSTMAGYGLALRESMSADCGTSWHSGTAHSPVTSSSETSCVRLSPLL